MREWLLVVYGRAWPKDVSELMHYLEERHQGAQLGKTVPQSIMASIFLMEQVGQVPLEARLSKDSILDKVVDPAAGSRRGACKAGADVHGGCCVGGRGDSGSDLGPVGPPLHVLHAPLDGLGMFEVR